MNNDRGGNNKSKKSTLKSLFSFLGISSSNSRNVKTAPITLSPKGKPLSAQEGFDIAGTLFLAARLKSSSEPLSLFTEQFARISAWEPRFSNKQGIQKLNEVVSADPSPSVALTEEEAKRHVKLLKEFLNLKENDPSISSVKKRDNTGYRVSILYSLLLELRNKPELEKVRHTRDKMYAAEYITRTKNIECFIKESQGKFEIVYPSRFIDKSPTSENITLDQINEYASAQKKHELVQRDRQRNLVVEKSENVILGQDVSQLSQEQEKIFIDRLKMQTPERKALIIRAQSTDGLQRLSNITNADSELTSILKVERDNRKLPSDQQLIRTALDYLSQKDAREKFLSNLPKEIKALTATNNTIREEKKDILVLSFEPTHRLPAEYHKEYPPILVEKKLLLEKGKELWAEMLTAQLKEAAEFVKENFSGPLDSKPKDQPSPLSKPKM